MTQKAKLLMTAEEWELNQAPAETVEQFLARGGEITYCEPQKPSPTGYYNQWGSSALTSKRVETTPEANNTKEGWDE
jgi:hypothetical protein